MNLQITIPPNWDSNSVEAFNKWAEKVYNHVKENKI